MKTIQNILKTFTLLALFSAAFFLIFSEPASYSSNWAQLFIASKCAGFLSGYIAVRLFKRWQRIESLSVDPEA